MMYALAKKIRNRYQPIVIAVTGSIGGSTTKAAIAAVLAHDGKRVRVAGSTGRDPRDIATALCGGDAAGSHIGNILHACRLLIGSRDPSYPEVIVAEYAADEVHEMRDALAVAIPDIGIFTSLAPVHLDRFGTLDRAYEEKALLARAITANGWMVLANDDPKICGLRSVVQGRVMTYGLGEGADVRASDLAVKQTMDGATVMLDGTNVKFHAQGSAVPVLLPGVFGGPQVHAALAAAAVGIIRGMNLIAIAEALHDAVPLPGRMRTMRGIKRSLLIDDTYNASAVSVVAGMSGVQAIELRSGGESFAVIGELQGYGASRESVTADIATAVVAAKMTYLVTVGQAAAAIGKEARARGMAEANITHFPGATEAGRFVQGRLEEGDMVFVAGSANGRLEGIVRELMAEPHRAKELLVRQT